MTTDEKLKELSESIHLKLSLLLEEAAVLAGRVKESEKKLRGISGQVEECEKRLKEISGVC